MVKPEPAPARPFSLQRETALRRRLAARDEQALVELIDLATPWLLGVAQGMLSDRDEAEEVVQEAFTAAWNHTGALGDEHEALRQVVQREFRGADRDGDGYLSRSEVAGRFPALERGFDRADTDRDGRISPQEFMRLRRFRAQQHLQK